MDTSDVIKFSFLVVFGIIALTYSGIENAKRAAARKAELERRAKIEENRLRFIAAHSSSWGERICQLLAKKQVEIGMTQDMVIAAWGRPRDTDQQQITEKWRKERWVYGRRRIDASYVSFKDGIVTAIKQTGID